MITTLLLVNDYCNNCPYFEPETFTTRLYADDRQTLKTQVAVSCKYSDHCRNLYKHIKKEEKDD